LLDAGAPEGSAGRGAGSEGYTRRIDWSLVHDLNAPLRSSDGAEDLLEWFATVSVPLFALLVALLWLGDRPGGPVRWRLACASALASAGVGLLANMAIGSLWFRERPFSAHPGQVVLVAGGSGDPSFPSDHATAAFAAGFAVFLVSRRAGALFLAFAVATGLSRVAVGLHYPSDVAAGAVIGFLCAVVVHRLARRPLRPAVELASRLTDPLAGRLWAALTRASAGFRGSRPPGPGAGSP
jgi:undecaprenyl-diphosphatase